MTQIVPILLIGVGGFLIGGVVSLWNKSRAGGVAAGAVRRRCVVGGLLWLLGES